jgi:hypothetical protein
MEAVASPAALKIKAEPTQKEKRVLINRRAYLKRTGQTDMVPLTPEEKKAKHVLSSRNAKAKYYAKNREKYKQINRARYQRVKAEKKAIQK